jgi:glutathione S-transferase
VVEKLYKKFDYVQNTLLKDKTYLVGDKFSIADSYLYIVLSWTGYVGVDLTPYPGLQAYSANIAKLPNVVAAHAAMATNPAST